MNENLPIILKILGWMAMIFSLILSIYLIGLAFLLKGAFDVSGDMVLGGKFAFWLFIAFGSILPLMEFMLGRSILKRSKWALVFVGLFIILGVGIALRQTGTAQTIDLVVTGFHVLILATLLYYRRLYGY